MAFSMYSKIPMPKIKWKDENMKYALVFFPFIGIVIGGMILGWWYLANQVSLGIFMKAAIMSVIPVFVNGGIHIDGFLDTIDALSSYQSKEKKLEILKDSHTGAFAIIGCVVYFLLYFGTMTEIKDIRQCMMIALVFVFSRALSGLSLVLFQSAKKNGLLYTFSSNAHKILTRILLIITAIICLVLWMMLNVKAGIVLILGGIVVFFYYKWLSYKEFGGITGDLAGFFLQVCELVLIFIVVFVC